MFSISGMTRILDPIHSSAIRVNMSLHLSPSTFKKQYKVMQVDFLLPCRDFSLWLRATFASLLRFLSLKCPRLILYAESILCGCGYTTGYHTPNILKFWGGGHQLQELTHHNNYANTFQHRNKLSTKKVFIALASIHYYFIYIQPPPCRKMYSTYDIDMGGT